MAKNDIEKQILDILNEVEGETGKAIKAGSEEAAQIITKTIRERAMKLWPNSKTGYPKNWTYQEDKHGYVVFNKKTYSLAHLLNNGHRVFNNQGKYIGMSKAKPHIVTQEEAEKISLECVYRRLGIE